MKEVNKFSEVSEEYDALICDVWGVIHNGKELFSGINECLKNYMEKDGVIVLLSTSGRFILPQILQIMKLALPFLTKFIGI